MTDREKALDMPEEYRISDEEISAAWGNANFGGRCKRQVILETLLQLAGGFATGHTAMCICRELKLLTPKSNSRKATLTLKGKRVMYYWNKHRAALSTPTDEEIEGLEDALEAERVYLESKCENREPILEHKDKYGEYPHETVSKAAKAYLHQQQRTRWK